MFTLFYFTHRRAEFCKKFNKTSMSNRKELAEKKARAYRLYMSGESQSDISEQVGISTVTLCKWAKSEMWEERLRDEKISSVELANSMMLAAKKMTEIIIR